MRVFGWIALALIAIPLQGFAVFWFRETSGSFFSQTGLECTLVPVVVELVAAIATAVHYDRIHSTAVPNPHSLIGKTLRDDCQQPPSPTPARAAWDGKWDS